MVGREVARDLKKTKHARVCCECYFEEPDTFLLNLRVEAAC